MEIRHKNAASKIERFLGESIVDNLSGFKVAISAVRSKPMIENPGEWIMTEGILEIADMTSQDSDWVNEPLVMGRRRGYAWCWLQWRR